LNGSTDGRISTDWDRMQSGKPCDAGLDGRGRFGRLEAHWARMRERAEDDGDAARE
jgi:hypothetical protein